MQCFKIIGMIEQLKNHLTIYSYFVKKIDFFYKHHDVINRYILKQLFHTINMVIFDFLSVKKHHIPKGSGVR